MFSVALCPLCCMSLCKVSLSEVLRRRTLSKIKQAYEHWSQDDDDGCDNEEDDAGPNVIKLFTAVIDEYS